MADDKTPNLEEALQALNKRNRNMMIAVILVALLGLGGTGGAFAYFLFFKEQPATAATAEDGHKEKGEEAAPSGPTEEKAMLGPIFEMEELLINLDTREGNRYLKLTLVMEVDEEDTLEELTKRLPQLQDITISLVSSKETVDLQGADGKFRLREELRYRYNKVLLKGSVTRVYFTQFVIQ